MSQYSLTERELDEVLALHQDNAKWHSERLLNVIPLLVSEIRKLRGTTGPTMERDSRIDYRKYNRNQRSNGR